MNIEAIKQHVLRRRIEFVKKLVKWSTKNLDDFPWRQSSDPYRILVAEVLLRRTRASKVAEVYHVFMHKFPNVNTLAKGRIAEIKRIVKPLGIASRSVKMREVARSLVENYSNEFPTGEAAMLSTIGVQSLYTINAIKCFAFGESVPIFDTNVKRILERVFSLDLGRDAHKKRSSWELAGLLVPNTMCKQYNLALLDVGRTICTPSNPKCKICPLQSLCDFAKGRCSEKIRVV